MKRIFQISKFLSLFIYFDNFVKKIFMEKIKYSDDLKGSGKINRSFSSL